MSAVTEAARLLRNIAEPRPVGDSVKSAINRSARRVSRHLESPMSAGRAEDIWREEARVIRAEEMDAIRAAAQHHRRFKNEATDELRRLDERIARLEGLLLAVQDARRSLPDEDSAARSNSNRAVDRT